MCVILLPKVNLTICLHWFDNGYVSLSRQAVFWSRYDQGYRHIYASYDPDELNELLLKVIFSSLVGFELLRIFVYKEV